VRVVLHAGAAAEITERDDSGSHGMKESGMSNVEFGELNSR